jgi:hypothetical protein
MGQTQPAPPSRRMKMKQRERAEPVLRPEPRKTGAGDARWSGPLGGPDLTPRQGPIAVLEAIASWLPVAALAATVHTAEPATSKTSVQRTR